MQAVNNVPVTDVLEGSERDWTEIYTLALGGRSKTCLFRNKRLTRYQSRKKSKPGHTPTRRTHPEKTPVKDKKSKTQQTKANDKFVEEMLGCKHMEFTMSWERSGTHGLEKVNTEGETPQGGANNHGDGKSPKTGNVK